jgi:hypothetical protein
MESKDLRVGNIVRLKDHFVGGNAIITGIMCDRITALNSVGTNIDTINIMYVEPIPITEELLVKIGFKKNRNGDFKYRDYNDRMSIRFSENYTSIEYANQYFNPEDMPETNYGSSLEFPNTLHLHTLQNIWYLLTGKELNIEL